MGGALKSVFGGSGGIFGAVLGVASMFFPPLAVAGSLSNLLTSAIGEGVKMLASTLVKEFGMPKFLEGLIGQLVDKVVAQSQHESSPQVDAHVQEQFGGAVQEFKNNFVADALNKTIEQLKKGGPLGETTGSNKKKSAASWLEAIAVALGEALGNKASQMVDLSGKISDLSGKGQTYDPKTPEGQKALKQNAEEINLLNARMSATGQEYNMISNTLNTVVKSLGEGLATLARKS